MDAACHTCNGAIPGSGMGPLSMKNQWIMRTILMFSEDFDLEMTWVSACLRKDDDVFRWVDAFSPRCLSLAVIEAQLPASPVSTRPRHSPRPVVAESSWVTRTPIHLRYHSSRIFTPVLETQSYRLPLPIAGEVPWTAIHAVDRPLRLRY